MTYAAWCSKLKVGAFSGGGLFVTAKGVEFENAFSFTERRTREFIEQSKA